MTKFLTLEEIAQSIEDNGLKQAFGAYFENDEETNELKACAIGQAAYNLKVTSSTLERALDKFKVRPSPDDSFYFTNFDYGKTVYLGTYITRLNDILVWDYKRIAAFIRGAINNDLGNTVGPVIEDEHDWH